MIYEVEKVILPDDFVLREIECAKHNIREAFKIGARAYIREAKKEIPERRDVYVCKTHKEKKANPYNREFLVREYHLMLHNIREAFKIGAEDYCKKGRRELKLLERAVLVNLKRGDAERTRLEGLLYD